MTYLGDTLTVGLVLILLFGSITLYLYTRIQQTEQKVNLLESIVLDLKLTGEIQGFSGLPMESESHLHPIPSPLSPPTPSPSSPISSAKDMKEDQSSEVIDVLSLVQSESQEEYKPFEEDETVETIETADSSRLEEISISPISAYDHMTLKELQSLVRSRGLVAEKGAKKSGLIELLKRADMDAEVKPGSMSSSSFLETSGAVHDDNE